MAIKKIHEEKNGVIGYVITKEEDLEKLPKNGIAITSKAILVNPTIGVKTYIFYDNDTDKNTDGEWIEWKAKYSGLGDNVKDFIKEYHEDLNKIVDVTNPKIGEGYNITINGSEEGVLNFEINGRTLQDVCKDKSNFFINGGSYDNGIITLTQNTSDVPFAYLNENFILKENTTYTLILEILENTIEASSNENNTNQVFSIASSGLGYGLWTIEMENTIVVLSKQTGIIRKIFVYRTNNVGANGSIVATGGYVLKHTSNPSGRIKFRLMFLEGDYTNTPIEELPFVEGIQGIGDATKNLFKKEYIPTSISEITEYIPIDSSKTYIISNQISDYNHSNGSMGYLYTYNENKEVIISGSIYWGASFTGASFVRFRNGVNLKFYDTLQLEEGTHATPYEPYYDGYKIEILSNGKNILKPLINFPFDIVKGDYVNGHDGKLLAVVKVKPNTKYIMSTKKSINKGRTIVKMSNRILKATELIRGELSQSSIYAYLNKNYANGRKFEYIAFNTDESIEFTTLDDCNYLYINVDSSNRTNGDSNGTITTTVESVQLEEITSSQQKATPYEPYHGDIKTYYLDEPLRGLPNGVCDTIEKDKVVRRVGKVVLNSANYNDWKKSDWNMNDIVRFDYAKSTTFAKGYSNIINLICDKFYAVDRDYLNLEENRNQECISINTTGQISINISKLKLSKEDVDGLSAWLQANPTTVYYELATPIEQQLPTIPTINSYDEVTHIYSTNYIQPFINIFDTLSIFKDANQYLNIECDRVFTLPNMDDLEDNAVKEIHMYIYMKEEATLTFPSDIKWETLSEFGKGDYVEIILTYVKTNGVGQWLGSAIVYNS